MPSKKKVAIASEPALTLLHLSRPKYRPDIDGLRAIAVLSVVAFHAFPGWIKGGFIGVDIFFVISGFLISTIIFENLENGTFSFGEFYVRRIRRIFPALVTVLASCFAFGLLSLLGDDLNQLGKHIAAAAGSVSNLILWSEAGYFDSSAGTKPLLHLWSLGIEEQFYILWPLLLCFSWKRKLNLFSICVIAAVISFALNIKNIAQDPVATFYSPQTRFWELLCGSLLAWLVLYKQSAFANIGNKLDSFLAFPAYRDKKQNDGRNLANVFSFMGFFLLAYGFLRINTESSFPGMWALVPVVGAVLIITAGAKAWINRTILSNKLAVWFGLISFPLYLWHWPLLSYAQIIYSGVPPREIRMLAVGVAILLSWLTLKVIEEPFRYGDQGIKLKVATLCGLVFVMGVSGFVVSTTDFSQSHTFEKLVVKQKRFEHVIGSSSAWYRGKGDWLFLGNAYDNTVAKLKLAVVPTDSELEATREIFSEIARTGAQHNTKVVLIVGPNKSNIYSEYLPDGISPSTKRYGSFFFDRLRDVPNLTVYDPTEDLLRLKKTEGIIYWMTDTHWNSKGAFLVYSGFSRIFGLPVPQVDFQRGSTYSGDLIGIAKLKDFPLHAEDNWDAVWRNKPVWAEHEIPNEKKTVFGSASIAVNQSPRSNMYVWVVGDSFIGGLKEYFNATFKEVRYVGFWGHKLKDLPADLNKADRKPDMIIVVRVERSF